MTTTVYRNRHTNAERSELWYRGNQIAFGVIGAVAISVAALGAIGLALKGKFLPMQASIPMIAGGGFFTALSVMGYLAHVGVHEKQIYRQLN